MNVFIRAIVRIFSFGERWNVLFNEAIAMVRILSFGERWNVLFNEAIAMVRIFSFGERWNVLFNSAIASLNRTFHLSLHENILTIALINIHYLYTIHGLTTIKLQHHRTKRTIELREP